MESLVRLDVTLALLTKSTPKYTKAKLDFYNLNKYFENRIAITPRTSESKEREALELIKNLNPEKILRAYFIGDKAEDVLVAPIIQDNYGVKSEGIYLNREGLDTPNEVISYFQIKTLNEIPNILSM